MLLVATQGARLLTRPGDFRDAEEAYNAAVGYVIWTAGLGDQWLALQNTAFCGGCSVVDALAAPVLGVVGDRFLAWKALAIAWHLATLWAGFAAMDRFGGRRSAWVFAALLAVPAPGLASMSLMLWGNHQETALWVLAAVVTLPWSSLAVGAITGGSIWFCRTAIYAAVVLIPAAAIHHRRPWALLAGFGAGASLLLLPAARGADLGYRMSIAENLFPNGVFAALGKLVGLVDPMRVAEPMYGPTPGAAVWAAWLVLGGVGGGVALAVARDRGPRRWLWVALLVSFAVVWAVSGFEPGRAAALINARYYAPWVLLLSASMAAGFGPWWDAGGRRRQAAAVVVGGALVANGVGWVASVARPIDWTVFEMPATDLAKFTLVAPSRLPPARVRAASSADPRVERALRRVEGAQAGAGGDLASASSRLAALNGPDRLSGFGMALAASPSARDLPAVNRWLASLPPETARSLGRGVARGLLDPAAPPGALSVNAEIARLRAGGSAVGGCLLCAAAGPLAVAACEGEARESPRRPANLAAVGRCLAGQSPEVLLGAGWAFRLRFGPHQAALVAKQLPIERRAAFEAGLDDPIGAVRRAPRQHGQSQ